MVDWQGLFKWSLSYNDGTTSNPDIKPMSEEDKKWLQQAIQSYSLDVPNRMKEIAKSLENAQDEEILILLEELSQLVEGHQNDLNLYLTGCLKEVLKKLLTSSKKEIVEIASEVFNSATQNSPEVQKWGLELGAMKLLPLLLEIPKHSPLKFPLFSSLSALVKSECIEAKVSFLAQGGMKLIKECILEDENRRIKLKALTLLRDLLYYDPEIKLVFPSFPSLRSNIQADQDILASLFNNITSSIDKHESKIREVSALCLSEILKTGYHNPHLKDKTMKQLQSIKEENLIQTLSQEVEALNVLINEAALKKLIEDQQLELENKAAKIEALKKKHGTAKQEKKEDKKEEEPKAIAF